MHTFDHMSISEILYHYRDMEIINDITHNYDVSYMILIMCVHQLTRVGFRNLDVAMIIRGAIIK